MGQRTTSTAHSDVAAGFGIHAPQWGNTPASPAQLCARRAQTTNARTAAAADVTLSVRLFILGPNCLNAWVRVERERLYSSSASRVVGRRWHIASIFFLPVLFLRHYICNSTSLFFFLPVLTLGLSPPPATLCLQHLRRWT